MATTIRHPISRIISNIEWHDISIVDLETWLTTSTIDPLTAVWKGSAAVDNFYIRTLLGEKVFLLPLGGITRFHLEEAMVLLSKFEIIMILEEIESDSIQAKALLGVDLTRVKPTRSGDQKEKKEWTTALMDQLKKQNELDMELYEWAKVRAKAINKAIGDGSTSI